MSLTINLAMYQFIISDEHNNRDYFEFDEIPHPTDSKVYYDLLNILNTILRDLKDSGECLIDECADIDSGKRIYLEEYFIENRTIYGTVRHGHSGNERIIKNVMTNSEKGKVDEEEGVFDPYYFLLVIPKGIKDGCLILEQKKGIGIRDIFKNSILGALINYPDYASYKIRLRRAHPKEIRERFYDNGELFSLSYHQYTPPEDLIDQMDINVGKIETLVRLDQDNPISPAEFFNKNKDDILTFQGVKYDEIKVVSKFKGKPKSFTLTNPETLIPYLNITDEIGVDGWEKGNPKLDVIHSIAKEHAKINFEKMWE